MKGTGVGPEGTTGERPSGNHRHEALEGLSTGVKP
jgi:hypothetical protein